MLEFKKILTTPFFSIEQSVERFGSPSEPYYRLAGADSVICCVLTASGHFVFVRQHRPNIEEVTLELPAGSCNDGETPSLAASREFEEETGMHCDFLYLGDFSLMMNRTNISEHIFFGFEPAYDLSLEPEEGISVELIDRGDILSITLAGGYRQLAGLGVIQLASAKLGLDVLSAPMPLIEKNFAKEIRQQ